MPELPEVETSRRGIAPHLENQTITRIIVRNPKLRWPISPRLKQWLEDKEIKHVGRRAKYLLIQVAGGELIIHLGMSGSVRIVDANQEPAKHDHVDLVLDSGQCLRFTDPRRFGCWLWSEQKTAQELLQNLGPEPLSEDFNEDYFWHKIRTRKAPIKQVIMDNKVVVGVGNIYAAESLFLSGIHPKRSANKVSKERIKKLTSTIKQVLSRAITQGGTTLKDFIQSDGKPGYFKQELHVYGRAGLACLLCGTEIKNLVIGQRASCYCPACQK